MKKEDETRKLNDDLKNVNIYFSDYYHKYNCFSVSMCVCVLKDQPRIYLKMINNAYIMRFEIMFNSCTHAPIYIYYYF